MKIFCTALYRAIAQGKHYTFRTAAALVKAFGNISDKAYLAREEMINKETAAGGIIVVGSHTAKTTAQLNELKNISDITFIELNSDLVLEEGKLEEETKRVLTMIQDLIRKGNTVCVSTKRALLKVENDTPEEALKVLKADLKSMDSSVALSGDDFKQVVTIKPLFTVQDYR